MATDRAFPTVVTTEDAARRLLATPESVVQEIEEGRLRGFCIGGEWRTTEEALLDFIHAWTASGERGIGVPQTENYGSGTTASDGHELLQLEWASASPFSYKWPDGYSEPYDEAYRADRMAGPSKIRLLIGFANRDAAGRCRRRAVVFLGEYPRIVPVVEFVGANDFDDTGTMASVVKLPRGNSKGHAHLKPGDDVPVEYKGFPLCINNDVVVGPYAARSMAVIAHKDDLTLMARHAAIRARWKGWL